MPLTYSPYLTIRISSYNYYGGVRIIPRTADKKSRDHSHMKPIRLLIVDDHELVREGIRFVLSGLPLFEIQGLASTAAEALQLISRCQPDVALVDLGLPTMETGLGFIEDIRSRFPRVKILAFTVHDETFAIHSALTAGADGYILKSAPISEFETAIMALASGNKYISPDISANVINGYLQQESATETGQLVLSRREREVLRLVSEGKGNKEIGNTLFISPRTVEKHKENLKRKLQCSSSVELAVYSLKHGILG